MSEWTERGRGADPTVAGFDPREIPQMIKQFLVESGFGPRDERPGERPEPPAGKRGDGPRGRREGPFGAWGDDWTLGEGGRGRHSGPGGRGGPRGRGGFAPPWAGLFGGPGGPFGGPGGPFGGKGPRRGRGDVRLAVLALLAEEPRHGYQMIQELEARSGGSWKPSPGSVYPTLQQLEDEGLIRAEEVEGRRVYRLTETGRTETATRGEEISALWASVSPEPAERGENLGEVIAGVATAFFHVSTTGTTEQRDRAREILARTRAELYQVLGEPTATPATVTGAGEQEAPAGTDGGHHDGGDSEHHEHDGASGSVTALDDHRTDDQHGEDQR